MINKYILLLLFIVFATNSYSTNIVVIDINYLINNSKHFKDVTNKINDSQKTYKEKLKIIENDLYKKKGQLEDSKFILSEEEFNIKKNEYYKEVTDFEKNVANFNNHYENEIIKIKNNIFSKISELIQNYASINQIDLILDKNQYLIASDKINISEKIFLQLEDIFIDLEFTVYEN